LQTRLAGPLYTDDAGVNAIGVLNDVLWIIKDGVLSTLYTFDVKTEYNGLTRAFGKFVFVDNESMSTYTIS